MLRQLLNKISRKKPYIQPPPNWNLMASPTVDNACQFYREQQTEEARVQMEHTMMNLRRALRGLKPVPFNKKTK